MISTPNSREVEVGMGSLALNGRTPQRTHSNNNFAYNQPITPNRIDINNNNNNVPFNNPSIVYNTFNPHHDVNITHGYQNDQYGYQGNTEYVSNNNTNNTNNTNNNSTGSCPATPTDAQPPPDWLKPRFDTFGNIKQRKIQYPLLLRFAPINGQTAMTKLAKTCGVGPTSKRMNGTIRNPRPVQVQVNGIEIDDNGTDVSSQNIRLHGMFVDAEPSHPLKGLKGWFTWGSLNWFAAATGSPLVYIEYWETDWEHISKTTGLDLVDGWQPLFDIASSYRFVDPPILESYHPALDPFLKDLREETIGIKVRSLKTIANIEAHDLLLESVDNQIDPMSKPFVDYWRPWEKEYKKLREEAIIKGKAKQQEKVLFSEFQAQYQRSILEEEQRNIEQQQILQMQQQMQQLADQQAYENSQSTPHSEAYTVNLQELGYIPQPSGSTNSDVYNALVSYSNDADNNNPQSKRICRSPENGRSPDIQRSSLLDSSSSNSTFQLGPDSPLPQFDWLSTSSGSSENSFATVQQPIYYFTETNTDNNNKSSDVNFFTDSFLQ